MFVGRRMTRSVVTVTKDSSVLHVRNLLREKDINQVPVVEGRKVIGVITDGDIRENSASPASTLSVHEINYLLSEMNPGIAPLGPDNLLIFAPGVITGVPIAGPLPSMPSCPSTTPIPQLVGSIR